MHKRFHIFDDARAVMIEEVKPKHEPIIRMEALSGLLGYFIGISNQGVLRCISYSGWVNGPLQGFPVCL